MEFLSATAPKWVNETHTLIDLLVEHPKFGSIPFSAGPSDQEEHGRLLFERAIAGEFGPIAEYVAPAVPVVIPQIVSKAQGIAALVEVGLWPSVKAYFSTEATETEQDLFEAITEFHRQSPLLLTLRTRFSLTDEELDNLFILANTKVI